MSKSKDLFKNTLFVIVFSVFAMHAPQAGGGVTKKRQLIAELKRQAAADSQKKFKRQQCVPKR